MLSVSSSSSDSPLPYSLKVSFNEPSFKPRSGRSSTSPHGRKTVQILSLQYARSSTGKLESQDAATTLKRDWGKLRKGVEGFRYALMVFSLVSLDWWVWSGSLTHKLP